MLMYTIRINWRRWLLACWCCLGLLTLPAAAEELARNGTLEESSPSGGAAGWTFDHWTQGNPKSLAQRDEQVVRSGKSSVKIVLAQSDDGKLTQVIMVKPDTWYRISAWVKTEGIPIDAKVGANISIIDAMDYSKDLKGDHDWQEIIAWGKTGPEQTEIKLALRLGFYGSLTQGTAWFDDISVQAAEPGAGAKVISFTPPSATAVPTQPASTNQSATLANLVTWLVTLSYISLAAWMIRTRNDTYQGFGTVSDGVFPLTKTWPAIALVLAILAIKIYWAGTYRGHSYDIDTFSSWALDIYQRGFADFYRPGYFADYPPGYITVLWLVGAIANWFDLPYGSPSFLVVLKMPSMLADIAGAAFLLWLGHKDNTRRNVALIAAILWLLNPLAIVTSTFWGQVDSIFTLILAASFLMLERRRIVLSAALYAAAIIFKPQALLVFPIALIALLAFGDIKQQVKAVGAALGTFILLSLPFTIFREPLWIFSLYGGTLASYDYLTVNAFNLYALLGGNWLPNETLFLGLPVVKWAWFLTLSALAAVIYGVIKGRGEGRYLFGAFTIYVLFFVVGPKMHERYLFPAGFIGLAAFIIIADKRVLWLAVWASLTTFVNTWVTLDILTRLNNTGVPNDNFFMMACSIANLALLIQTFRVGYSIFLRGQRQLFQPHLTERGISANAQIPSVAIPAVPVEVPLAPISRRAWLALAAICATYTVAAFTYLGSTQAPEKFWNPPAASDWAVFDLGNVQQVRQLQYHHGLGEGEYAVQWSRDGQNWIIGGGIVINNRFSEFRWRNLDVNLAARYFKIGLSTGTLQMNEIAVLNDQNTLVTPILSAGPNDAVSLIDEQDKTVAFSTAYNGMYFDEVYHARSAWEILQGIDATENTHPPLGKILIASGVWLFGMNPFGWRFVGTAFGILMLPVFFSLSRRLFRSENFALVATTLLAVDFMHFTQTRIASIDTYGVFFILASSYWMLRWMQHEPATQDWRSDVKSLLLCGTMFGLGAASKWIVLYQGVGLAILYCWNLWRQAKVAQSLPTKLPGQRGYGDWFTQSVLWSVLGFIVIPALIYTAAYIPSMQATGQGISGMLNNQTDMYRYHSQLNASHPFSSMWYELPTMIKPVWYYSGSEWTGPLSVSSISAFGNPVTWYLGTLAFLLVMTWRLTLASSKSMARRFAASPSQIFALGFIITAGLAQFLPWALIPRTLLFIYHFFASVPFIILALVWGLQRLQIDNPQSVWAKYLSWGVVTLSLICFIAYFPVISGYPVPRGWVEWISKGPVTLYF